MTPMQLMKHYNNNETEAAYMLNVSRPTIRNWIRSDRIPLPMQTLVEKITGGKLMADIPKALMARQRK